ncbi:hypothetical protein [Hymenobacter sp. GOD-10R]|uniref:hypothetical protein n=1 Tax=Hymenobacter sp. GOD-10R TaxID=3093922 RepID=UPI002D77AA1B|nr:hypothetical protein [Hymenobacter sp. GOD-10R]WRQ28902.1 hypothetical protein SD425_01315 [Hymenobacter sp. GOD-10R]
MTTQPRFLRTTWLWRQDLATLVAVFGLGLLSSNTWAQTQTPTDTTSPFRLLPNYGANEAFSPMERIPVFKKGGNIGLSTFIRTNQVPLPPGAKVLLMSFVVDKNGKSKQAKLNTLPGGISIPTSTYQKVAHILKSMDFVPAQQEGKPVSFPFTIPLARSK